MRWVTFRGFNGTDDLHYAMLASNLLKGKYSPFAATDIFSGRILIVLWQAFIYYIGGINTFTTQIGTIFTTVFCCYLTIFKLAKYNKWQVVLLGASLFYFNPVLNEATIGVMPDVYILLCSILILLLCKQINEEEKINWFKAALCGFIVFIAMFFKENALVFIPFLFLISLTGELKKTIPPMLVAIGVFFLCILISGVAYYHFTGNFFFRVLQIKNADYLNQCSYNSYSLSRKIIRLTYGVWQQFIIQSFYPVILAALLIIFRLFFDKSFAIRENTTVKSFLILLLVGLYFPFSLSGYQPLCFKARHFIFLLSPAVILCVSFLEEAKVSKTLRLLFIIVSSFILIVCINSTGSKWYWLLYGILFSYFACAHIISTGFLFRIKYFLFAGILFLYMFENLFFLPGGWFQDMKRITKKATGTAYYFPDHDNMMHLRLLHGFVDDKHYYNLEKYPFKIYRSYYEIPDKLTFEKGWFIVNKYYTVMHPSFFMAMDSLKKDGNFFTIQFSEGYIDALFIDSPEKLQHLIGFVQKN